MLKETFIQLIQRYTNNPELCNELWIEIETHYSEPHRYYHTLSHLEHLLSELQQIKEHINNWDALLFALYYHDIIYDPAAKDNEEQSAEHARQRLQQISMNEDQIHHCIAIILATKSHQSSDDNDINYFTDADLSVLGQPWNIYKLYSENVRKEYSIFPSHLYNPGRKKVLDHFIDMKRIFKTSYFFNKYEKQARLNLMQEANYL